MGGKKDEEPFLRLWDAAFDNDEMKVTMLLAMGEDVNQQDPDTGSTPLYIAAQCGNVKVINVLINDGGADVNLPKKDGATPLCAASQFGKIEAAEALIAAGADKEAPTDGVRKFVTFVKKSVAPPLHIAVIKKNVEMAMTLVQAGVDVNQRWNGKEGITPLYAAAKFGYCDVVRMLIRLKANVNAPSLQTGGATPICAAAQYGRNMVVSILEKAGADRRPAEDLGLL